MRLCTVFSILLAAVVSGVIATPTPMPTVLPMAAQGSLGRLLSISGLQPAVDIDDDLPKECHYGKKEDKCRPFMEELGKSIWNTIEGLDDNWEKMIQWKYHEKESRIEDVGFVRRLGHFEFKLEKNKYSWYTKRLREVLGFYRDEISKLRAEIESVQKILPKWLDPNDREVKWRFWSNDLLLTQFKGSADKIKQIIPKIQRNLKDVYTGVTDTWPAGEDKIDLGEFKDVALMDWDLFNQRILKYWEIIKMVVDSHGQIKYWDYVPGKIVVD